MRRRYRRRIGALCAGCPTVRDLPDDVREALRVRAAQHGRSTEAEVRAILMADRR
ncbi:FitA-like ribbon-helix-helix domain-containing protein [Nocardia rhamnosiphila]